MRRFLPVVTILAATAPSHASELTIPLAPGVTVETTQAIYQCAEREMPVTYINAGSISLALLDIDGQKILASNVISASGARYAGAQYVWWSKGNEAMLFNVMEGDEDAPVATCTERD
jgi:membrane-bound inhibitor of C-type lysozyme